MAQSRSEIYNRWAAKHPEYFPAYRKRAADQRREYLRQWRAKNPEKYEAQKERVISKRRSDPEQKERDHQRYIAQREHILAVCGEWRERTKEERKAYFKKWRAENKDKRAEYKQARRARVRSTPEVRAKIKLLFLERFCRWCCTHLNEKNRSVDHVTSLVRGGKHIPDNLVASCRRCNWRKNDKLVSEWLPFQTFKGG